MTTDILNGTSKAIFLCDPSGLWKTKDGKHLIRIESEGGVPLPDVTNDAIFAKVTLFDTSSDDPGVYGVHEGLRFFSVMPKRNFHLHVVSLMQGKGEVEVMLSLNKQDQYKRLYGGII